MSLDCVNWTDKQLDELVDVLRSGDQSIVATFMAQNFLCVGSRIMTDPDNTTLRLSVGSDTKTVSLSPGAFQHAGFISQVGSAEVINILNTSTGKWGVGKIADSSARYSIVMVKWNDRIHTPGLRFFVDDTVVPNTYFQQNANTLVDKAYYDIVVKHGTPGGGVPDADPGFWTIGEIYIPANAASIDAANIYDVGCADGSQRTPPNWVSTTRVLRLEFMGTSLGGFSKFAVDHDPVTGYHRTGFHIGSVAVGASVTAPALTKLSDGSVLSPGELHSHGAGAGLGVKFLVTPTGGGLNKLLWTYVGAIPFSSYDWTDVNVSGDTGSDVPKAVLLAVELRSTSVGAWTIIRGIFRKKGSSETDSLPRIDNWAMASSSSGVTKGGAACMLIVPCDASGIFQAKVEFVDGQVAGQAGNLYFKVDMIGYFV